MSLRSTSLLGAIAALSVACGAGSAHEGAGGAGGGSSTTTGGPGGGGVAGGFTTSTGVGGAEGPPVIYAHTDTTLFQLDPTSPSLALAPLGDFDCIPAEDTAMTDFAVDRDQHAWGVSAHAVHPLTIQSGAVHCGAAIPLAQDVRFYGLTFAPAGVLDPTKEVLVAGNSAGELWSIDDAGQLAMHGTFGQVPANDGNGHTYANAGKAWELSGDIVFLANGGKPVGFATARDCPSPPSTNGCNAVNTLIEIDVPKLATATSGSVAKSIRGQIVRGQGCSDATNGDYGNLYGIAAWNAQVYGFSRTGNLVAIDLVDGSACLVQAYATDKFAGAGVTTTAPIDVPPPK